MKKLETYKKSGNFINALEQKDIDEIKPKLLEITNDWYLEWQKQGSVDEGSCCGGKGFDVWFVRPRGRKPDRSNIVNCSWVQGNISAYKSHKVALSKLNQILKPYDVEAEYNDGWMD